MADELISPRQPHRREKSETKQPEPSSTGPQPDDSGPDPTTGPRRRVPRMPDPAEFVDQLQRLSGLTTMGLLPVAQANLVFRCISKAADIVTRQ